jgi:RNA polymerase sigma-70 factor, ECF subfamily
VLQKAYVRALATMDEFRNESSLSTWLMWIVLNEAPGHVREKRPTVGLDVLGVADARDCARMIPLPLASAGVDPERAAARQEISRVFEKVVDELPNSFWAVFMMRTLEEMSIEETALALGLRLETVKTRLHRARRLLRDALATKPASVLTGMFPFEGWRCAKMTDIMLGRLHAVAVPSTDPLGPDDVSG